MYKVVVPIIILTLKRIEQLGMLNNTYTQNNDPEEPQGHDGVGTLLHYCIGHR